jgi:predicted dehydrogenase
MGTSSETRKIRYAVVGAGNIAQVAVLPAFQHAAENSELGAIISGDHEKLSELGKRYHVALTGSYNELEDVLDRGRIDAVYVALPNRYHREFTLRAARAGVHVLCEKPMALTEDDCQAMIHGCEEHGVKLMVAYRLHFEECNLQAIELVRSGRLGEPRFFTSAFAQEVRAGDIRTRGDLGGGALYDMGVYCINAARNLFQSEPTEAFAFTMSGQDPRFRDVDEVAAALLRFPGGRIAELVASQGAADVSSYRVVGTTGDLRVEPAYDYAAPLAHHLTVDGKTRTKVFDRRDQFAPELVYFSRCILEDREPEPSGLEGLADVRVVRALLESGRSGRPQRLGVFDKKVRPDMSLNMKMPPVKKPRTVHAPAPTLR